MTPTDPSSSPGVDNTTLRPPALGDADDLAALYARNREFLRPFEPDRDDRFFTADGQRARELARCRRCPARGVSARPE